MRRKIFALVLATGFITLSGIAQPPRGPQVSAEQMAGENTKRIAEQLDLTEKQRKKVYKLYLRQAREIEKARTPGADNRMAGGPGERGGMMAGGPGGMRGGGPGGGPGGGRGGMQGGPGGRGGPGGEAMGQGGQPGGRPDARPAGPYEEPEKSVRKRDSKMRKILTGEQYGRWIVIEKEMQYERFRDEFMNPDTER
ncbi:MAG: hypothetical protein LUE26_03510 [Alistipes sp.]|nr:hypothetical protein [Alistipes sp.]